MKFCEYVTWSMTKEWSTKKGVPVLDCGVIACQIGTHQLITQECEIDNNFALKDGVRGRQKMQQGMRWLTLRLCVRVITSQALNFSQRKLTSVQ